VATRTAREKEPRIMACHRGRPGASGKACPLWTKSPLPGWKAGFRVARTRCQFTENRVWNEGDDKRTARICIGSRSRTSFAFGDEGAERALVRELNLTATTARQAIPRRETRRNIKLSGERIHCAAVHSSTAGHPWMFL
jgi:hypothetical protein